MKRCLIFLLCLYCIAQASVLCASEELVKMSYVGRSTNGTDRWRATSEIKNISPGIYMMTEKAEGVYSPFKGRVSWIAEMKFERTKDSVRPISLDKKIFDSRGNIIRREKQEFDLAGKTGVCTHEEPLRKISRTRKFKFDKDVVTRLSLGLYAQKFLESGKVSESLQMVSEEPNVYNIELKRMGKEVVEIGGRRVVAYRLCVDPKLGALNFVKKFLPKAYAWHLAMPDYTWLGYSGLEGGINSEKVKVLVDKI